MEAENANPRVFQPLDLEELKARRNRERPSQDREPIDVRRPFPCLFRTRVFLEGHARATMSFVSTLGWPENDFSCFFCFFFFSRAFFSLPSRSPLATARG